MPERKKPRVKPRKNVLGEEVSLIARPKVIPPPITTHHLGLIVLFLDVPKP
jgi:hypothetical protein